MLAGDLIAQNQVVCVYATAGAGKTTAVRHAVERLERRVAWLSVDTTDDAPGRLLTYLEAALAVATPAVQGVVNAALGAQLPHTEVAGLLAEAIGDAPVLLVIDDLERIASSADALAVLGGFAHYLPSTARLVLISRRELSLPLAPSTMVVGIDESVLAFTCEEAAEALARTGRPDTDATAAVAMTGGWVTGVLFEAWRSSRYASGLGGEADPLFGYLAVHILEQLTAEQRDFLVLTSVLHEVTAEAATALDVPAAGRRLHSLRAVHLPATWDEAGTTMRCHPRFREYLLRRLRRRDGEQVREIRRAHGRLLRSGGHVEEATEEFLEADALEDAVRVAGRAIQAVVERADFAVARRWLNRLAPVRSDDDPAFAGAELMMALVDEDYRRGLDVADRLSATGHRDEIARSSSRVASLMAWCYMHAGRVDDIRAVLAAGRPGTELDAMRYCLTLVDSTGESEHFAVVPLTGGPLDALIMRTHYYYGRLPLLLEEPASQWAVRASESWRLGALLSMGQVEQAADLYRAICEARDPGPWLSLFRVELLREQGRRDEAWRALLKERERIRASGSAMLEAFSYITEVGLELRLNRDTSAARAVLAKVQAHPVGRTYRFIAEQAETWLGLALLLENENEAAAGCLRRAVSSMLQSGRCLVLPAAAVYLAEAEWRLDDEESADQAMDVALDSADRQGSNHALLEALAEFPAVLSRRLDAEPTAESPWHGLGRALMARGVCLAHPVGAALRLREFGRMQIEVDGVEVRPRLKKSYELLAYLAHCPEHQASRDDLLAALFGARHDASATSYLRQAVRWLRDVLPGEGRDIIDTAGGLVQLVGNAVILTESEEFERLVARAAVLRGRERYGLLMRALSIADEGPYLAGVTAPWAEERRQELGLAIVETRCAVAELAFAQGDYQQTGVLVERALREDPYRESMWRLSMRLADAVGDPDGVIGAYRRCEQALEELGTNPCPTTARLLDDLRR